MVQLNSSLKIALCLGVPSITLPLKAWPPLLMHQGVASKQAKQKLGLHSSIPRLPHECAALVAQRELFDQLLDKRRYLVVSCFRTLCAVLKQDSRSFTKSPL